MNWFNRLRQKKQSVGLEFCAEHISIVVNDLSVGICQSKALEYTIKDHGAEAQALLKNFVEDNNLKNLPCFAVLPAVNYQLLLVEKPDVPDGELRDAIKWKLRDLIQTSIEKTVVDIFSLPDDARRTGKDMLYAVVADLEKVQLIIESTAHAGLSLQVIDIEVFALRNLAVIKQPERALAIVRLRAGEADVSIYRAGDLYLSRRFQLAYGAGLLDDIPADALALEIQRSFDYFERQMGQAPPTILYICGESISEDKITEDVRRSLSVPIELLDLSDQIAEGYSSNVDESLAQMCIAAIGATYREKVA